MLLSQSAVPAVPQTSDLPLSQWYALHRSLMWPKCDKHVSFCETRFFDNLYHVFLDHFLFSSIADCRLVVMRKSRRVALLFDPGLGFCRAVVRGIQAYAEEKAKWTLYDALPTMASMEPLVDWNPNGVIAHLFYPEVARTLENMPFPVVNFTSALVDCKFPLVEVDHHQIGRLAAEFFLERGYQRFGFFGSEWAQFSLDREETFRQVLEEHGFTCSSCYEEFLPRRPTEKSWTRVERHIASWLRKLKKPVAIFVSNDVPAKYLTNVCRALSIRIPQDASLLSVDNIEFDCSMARPRLSSIAIPDFRIGYEAAALLDRIMQGKRTRSSPLFLPPLGVVLRESTDETAVDDQDIMSMMAWIRKNYGLPVSIDDICAAIGVGRRALERKMHRLVGRSILYELQRVRIEAARHMLADDDTSIETIALRCGFSGARRMSVLFRQELGQTPTEFRKRCRGQVR